jgi:hypothetical protein
MHFSTLATSFGPLEPYLGFIIVFAALLGYGFWKGGRGLGALLIAFYPATILYGILPYRSMIPNFGTPAHATLFTDGILFLIFLVLSSYALSCLRMANFEGSGASIWLIVLAVIGAVFVCAFLFHVIPATQAFLVPAQLSSLIVSTQVYFWILLIPFAAIIFAV